MRNLANQGKNFCSGRDVGKQALTSLQVKTPKYHCLVFIVIILFACPQILKGKELNNTENDVEVKKVNHKISFYTKLEKKLTIPTEGPSSRIKVVKDGKVTFWHLVWRKRSAFLVIPNLPEVKLGGFHEVDISQDGQVILKKGEYPLWELTPASPINFYWMDSEGKLLNSVKERFDSNTYKSLSIDGFTGISGRLTNGDKHVLELYSPRGERIWTYQMENGAYVDVSILVSKHGEAVITKEVVYPNPGEHRRIRIYRDGKVASTIQLKETPADLRLLDDNRSVLYWGIDCFGLVDIESGNLLWQVPREIYMVSPKGIAMSPDQNIIFFMVLGKIMNRRDKLKPDFGWDWELFAMEKATGNILGSHKLRNKVRPQYQKEVFGEISESEINIISDNTHLVLDWMEEVE